MAVVVLALTAAGRAAAFLDTGTLLTNAAAATFVSGGVAASVTFSATARLLLANPVVFLWKYQTPTAISSAGGTVTYTICFSNGGANTAFNVTIKDRLSNNSYWNSAAYSAWAVNLAGAAYVPNAAWSYGGVTWAAGMPPAGQPMGIPYSASPAFLQWVLPALGVGRSGCITFTVHLL